MLGAVSQYERAMMALRLRAGRKRKHEGGGYAYGRPPYGWRADKTAPTGLAPHPDEQAVIAVMRERQGKGLSFRPIASELDARGIKPPGGESWGGKLVGATLRREKATA